jgi:GT2 family glycosyltransferase
MSRCLIQCVVVLYECTLDDSKTLQSFAEVCRLEGTTSRQISLLVYDNSPNSQQTDLERWNCGTVEYRHASENGGLAAAYNYALSRALEAKIEWLLLLDQDTVLTQAFFLHLLAAVASPLSPKICAIVPKLIQAEKILSPQFVGIFRNSSCSNAFSGLSHDRLTAFNSAACLRVSAVMTIGGFPAEYWLDFLDHIVFHRLQADGSKVLVLEVFLEHQLSWRNLESEMSLSRYTNLISAEWRFIRETGVGGGPALHRLRLLNRALVYSIRFRNKAYALKTLRAVAD